MNERHLSETYTRAYRDVLQLPLQPLGDHLENGTYETFERDPVKYGLYERAIGRALGDLSRREAGDGQERERERESEDGSPAKRSRGPVLRVAVVVLAIPPMRLCPLPMLLILAMAVQ